MFFGSLCRLESCGIAFVYFSALLLVQKFNRFFLTSLLTWLAILSFNHTLYFWLAGWDLWFVLETTGFFLLAVFMVLFLDPFF